MSAKGNTFLHKNGGRQHVSLLKTKGGHHVNKFGSHCFRAVVPQVGCSAPWGVV
jgi:hypothetical protein